MSDETFKRYKSINKIAHVEALLGTFESFTLDFKEKDASKRDFSSNDKTNYAKAASGFANEEGGIIVWGIKCKPDQATNTDVASELKPINNIMGFVSSLNSLANETTDPTLGGIQNKIIKISDKDDSGYAVTHIPNGEDFPYKARLGVNDFYGRSASNFYPLSTSQIKRLMLFVSRPHIDVIHRIEKDGQSSGSNGVKYSGSIYFSLLNTGRSVTTHPYFSIKGPNGWKIKNAYEYSHTKPLDRIPFGAYVGGVDTACHPNVPVDVVVIRYDLNQSVDVGIADCIVFEVSCAAMNFPLQHKTIKITHKEMSDVWGVDLCKAEPSRY